MARRLSKLLSTIIVAIPFLFVGCTDSTPFYEPLDTALVGTWSIDGSQNTISFDGEGIFTINDSIYGSYFIDENNINNVIWIYDRLDTMRFIDYIANYNTIMVENMPVFEGKRTLFKK